MEPEGLFVFHFPITPCGHEGKEQNGEEPHVRELNVIKVCV